MTRILKVLILLNPLILLCSPQGHGGHKQRIIGYELYSWRDKTDNWVFSLLPDTSSEKTVEAVFNDQRVLHGVDQLKSALAKLPAGEQIFWVDRIPSGTGPKAPSSESLTFPPTKMRNELKAYLKNRHITLEVLLSSRPESTR